MSGYPAYRTRLKSHEGTDAIRVFSQGQSAVKRVRAKLRLPPKSWEFYREPQAAGRAARNVRARENNPRLGVRLFRALRPPGSRGFGHPRKSRGSIICNWQRDDILIGRLQPRYA